MIDELIEDEGMGRTEEHRTTWSTHYSTSTDKDKEV